MKVVNEPVRQLPADSIRASKLCCTRGEDEEGQAVCDRFIKNNLCGPELRQLVLEWCN